jgi:uncharacterized membrane protein YsdA (DUF1294 family)
VFWFIPTTHKVVIAALLVIAAASFVLFWATRVQARREGRREERALMAQAAVHHGVRAPDSPPPDPHDE